MTKPDDAARLFDPDTPGLWHAGDPSTSIRAATNPAHVARFGTQRYAMLEAYSRGPQTPDEAGRRAGVAGYSPRRRSSELEAAGLIEPEGSERAGCRVLRITPAGVLALEAGRT